MKIIRVTNPEKIANSIQTSRIYDKSLVSPILDKVRKQGDKAVKYYEKKFNTIISNLKVSDKEIANAYSVLSKEDLLAIREAKSRLEKTEKAIRKKLSPTIIKIGCTKIKKSFVPIHSVGCYVPGGLARYPSSAIMSVVPAKVAGVKRIIVVTPPDKKGNIDPMTLAAADMCGANEIYKTGGAQAIAALAYGTKAIQKVDKIVGPGGMYVTIAKSMVSDQTSIDMVAGPTELGIIADSETDAILAARDLVSQAEHSTDTLCFVITTSDKFAQKLVKELDKITRTIKRQEIVQSSLSKNGFVAICNNTKDIITLANLLAPEHLQIMTKNPQELSKEIFGAGLVILGQQTPSSASDYLLGSNHILPTNRFGRVRGSLSVLDFLKLHTELASTKNEMKKISHTMETFTKAEGLSNHYEAVRERL